MVGVGIGSEEIEITEEGKDWVEVEAIEFETLIVEEEQEAARGSEEQKRYQVSAELLGKQARFGAAGNSEIRRAGNGRYRTTRRGKYQIAKEGWSMVGTEDLRVRGVEGNEEGKPTNYSEAVQALSKLKQENPAQARAVKILRLSEVAESVR